MPDKKERRIFANPTRNKDHLAQKKGPHRDVHGPDPRRRQAGARTMDQPSHVAGTYGTTAVWVEDALGAQGDDLAKAVLSGLADPVRSMMSWFGVASLVPHNLIISKLSDATDGSGGAYHYGCDATDLYCDADFTDGSQVTLALYVAEMTEVLMAAGGKGWDCGASAGEGLSRYLAESAYPGVLDSYSTFAAWLDSDRDDWINTSEPTDTNAISTGASVGFLFFLQERYAITPNQIAQGKGDTLANLWADLGLEDSAEDSWIDACYSCWPPGQPSNVRTDNPWPDCQAPPPPPPPAGEVCISITLPATPGTYTFGAEGQTFKLSADEIGVVRRVRAMMAAGTTPGQIDAVLAAVEALTAHAAEAAKLGKERLTLEPGRKGG